MDKFRHDPKKLDEAITKSLRLSEDPKVHPIDREKIKSAHQVLTRIKACRASKVPKPN